ncbi:MAG: hypothetical protein ACOYM3_20160, partial [Terrimicrobiaceae bacterium]
ERADSRRGLNQAHSCPAEVICADGDNFYDERSEYNKVFESHQPASGFPHLSCPCEIAGRATHPRPG